MRDISDHTLEDYPESYIQPNSPVAFELPKPRQRTRKKPQPRRTHLSKKGLLFLYRPPTPHNTTQYLVQKKVTTNFDDQELTGSMLHLISLK